MTANMRFPIASTASLIGDPARAAILLALLEGRSLVAGELARRAQISAQSASMHLSQLLQGGLVEVTSSGRHRFYRIASADVCYAVEALGIISSSTTQTSISVKHAVRFARICYDHLAGELAVRLADFFEMRGLIVSGNGREYGITDDGEKFFRQWNINIAALKGSRRALARRCLDRTERRPHVGGSLGASICRRMLDLNWLRRDSEGRALHLTASGRRELKECFPGTT